MKEAGRRRGRHPASPSAGGRSRTPRHSWRPSTCAGIPWAYVPVDGDGDGGLLHRRQELDQRRRASRTSAGTSTPRRRCRSTRPLARTLPVEARVSGLAEAVKICFAAGPEVVRVGTSRSRSRPPRLRRVRRHGSPAAHVLSAKKWFIEVDEFDRAERQTAQLRPHLRACAGVGDRLRGRARRGRRARGPGGARHPDSAVDAGDQAHWTATVVDLLAPIRDERRAGRRRPSNGTRSSVQSPPTRRAPGRRFDWCCPPRLAVSTLRRTARETSDRLAAMRDCMAAGLEAVTA